MASTLKLSDQGAAHTMIAAPQDDVCLLQEISQNFTRIGVVGSRNGYLDAIVKRKNVEEQRLSGRETEVLRLLAGGNAPSEIAQAMQAQKLVA